MYSNCWGNKKKLKIETKERKKEKKTEEGK
jgi:hypothetical protein